MKIKSSWLNIRESTVSLLKILALSIVLIQLSAAVIGVFTSIDDPFPWEFIVLMLLMELTRGAFYGGIVFALAWIVSLIGRQREVRAGSSWLDNRESAVSLLKIFAVLIVLFQLTLIGIIVFETVDNGGAWYHIVQVILQYITLAAWYGGIIFALAWIVSLIGRQDEAKAVSRWLGNRESAVSLLKKSALLILLLHLPIAAISAYMNVDSDMFFGTTWDWIMDSVLYTLYTGIFHGGVLFAVAWLVSLIGERKSEEAG
ncbi:hypothetical protein ACFLW2_02160 [Chloroflexota bacterium]